MNPMETNLSPNDYLLAFDRVFRVVLAALVNSGTDKYVAYELVLDRMIRS